VDFTSSCRAESSPVKLLIVGRNWHNLRSIQLERGTLLTYWLLGFLDLHEKTLMMTPDIITTAMNLEEIPDGRGIRYTD
jgi:hypothetical protein